MGQSFLEVRGYVGVSGAMANWNEDLDGASSVEMKNFKEVGVSLSKGLGKKFSIAGSVNYSFAEVNYNPNFSPCINCFYGYSHNPDFQMLSIPVYAEYGFGQFFYAVAGPVINFQLSEGNNFTDQSGIGYLAGLGAKWNTEKLAFSIFPNYKRHSVVPFEKAGNHKQVLQELGIQLGVGYQF